MLLSRLEDLAHADECAVVVNCSTKLASTLALLSTLRHAQVPVLLIDCESSDGSFDHFRDLMSNRPFDLLSAPLRGHGLTLDWLFQTINADKVLLVDSDIEILDAEILEFMRKYIDEPSTFGAGFVNGPTWIDDLPGNALQGAFLQERLWIPFTLLKVRFIREALAAGVSFRARTIYNDFFFSEYLSHQFAWYRSRIAALKRWQTPKILRRSYYGHTPSVVYCDTGADMLQHLKYKRELAFISLPERFHERYLTHFGGLTRAALDQLELDNAKRCWVQSEIRRRLREGYGMEFVEQEDSGISRWTT